LESRIDHNATQVQLPIHGLSYIGSKGHGIQAFWQHSLQEQTLVPTTKQTIENIFDIAIKDIYLQCPSIFKTAYDLTILLQKDTSNTDVPSVKNTVENSSLYTAACTLKIVQISEEDQLVQRLEKSQSNTPTILAVLQEKEGQTEAIFFVFNVPEVAPKAIITEISANSSLANWSLSSQTAKYIDVVQQDQIHTEFYQETVATNSLHDFKHFHWSVATWSLFGSCESLLRAVLATYSEIIPPSEIASDDTVKHYKEAFPWFHSLPHSKRKSISCFANQNTFHTITVEEATEKNDSYLFQPDKPQLLVFSAPSQRALQGVIQTALDQLTNFEEDVYTLSRKLNKQHHQSYRLACSVAPDTIEKKLQDAISLLEEAPMSSSTSKKGITYGICETAPKIAFTYPGQGSQYTGMLQDLALHFPEMRSSISDLDQALYGINKLPNSTIVYPPEGNLTTQEKTMLQQELYNMEGGATNIVISSVAVFDLLKKCGVLPEVHLGHSHGENTALNTAGILSSDRNAFFELVTEISRRGSDGIEEGQIPVGKFISVALFQQNIDHILEAYKDDIYIAMDNCPHQFVVFGKNEIIKEFQKAISDLGAICISLPFDRAYHTPFFEREMRFIQPIYDSITLYRPTAKVFSCIDLDYFSEDPIQIKSKLGKQWTNCVRFREAIDILYKDGITRFIEVGPGSTLTGFTNDTLHGKDFKALSCDVKQKSSLKQLQFILAKLFVDGVAIQTDIFLKKEVPAIEVIHERKSHKLKSTETSIQAETTTQKQIVTRHFELMNQFLKQQEQISKQFFEGQISVSQETNTTQELPPLLDGIVEVSTTEVVFEKTLLIDQDIFLKDHTLGRFSEGDNTGYPLPVMPFVTTMELIAEAASYWATDNLLVTKLKDIRGHKWIALDQESLRLLIVAKKENNQTIKIQVFTDQVHPTHIVAEGTAILSEHYALPPELQISEMKCKENPIWDAKDFNETCLFHGPSFTSMESLIDVGDTGIVLELKNPSQQQFLAHKETTHFKTPGAILDASGQMVAYWLVEQGETHFGSFPFYVASFELYDHPRLAEGQKIKCAASFEKNNDILIGDYQFYDQDKVLFSIEGLHSKYYDFPKEFLNCLYWEGRGSYLSQPLSIDTNLPVQLRRIADIPNGFLDQGGAIWLRALAHIMLSKEEKDTWYALSDKGTRRKEWLLGRVVAKEAVRSYADQYYSLILSPRDIEVIPSALGKPMIICDALAKKNALPDISISHSLTTAIAAVVPKGMTVGIDLELIHKKEESYNVGLVFDQEEKELLQGRSLLPFFCAKEAAAKSLGIPFLGSYTAWKIITITNDIVTIQHEHTLLDVYVYTDATEVTAVCVHTRKEKQLLNH